MLLGGKKGFYKAAGGLSVYINCMGVTITITNITSRNNSGNNSGNVALFLTTADSSIVVDHSHIANGKATKGGGLRFWYKQNQDLVMSTCSCRISHTLKAMCRNKHVVQCMLPTTTTKHLVIMIV